ncbi:hypothetical protein OAQ99_03595 [Candidatus Kapabacteria bacterium]|nr:hypothetical protein [Candidatus Kapabacteria bacterium]
MSGSAGKVYFVLYLAVVLELLIIIVERDEAEEHLHQKQKETMKIVKSILSQLQAGAGTEGITTKPQDEVSVPSAELKATGMIKDLIGADIKSDRRYLIAVGVTDVSGVLDRMEAETDKEYIERLEKNVKLANVENIQYEIFYNPSDEQGISPPFPNDSILNEFMAQNKITNMNEMPIGTKILDTGWELKGVRDLYLDHEAMNKRVEEHVKNGTVGRKTVEPIYKAVSIGQDFKPSDVNDENIFFYAKDSVDVDDVDADLTQSDENKSNKLFVVNFEPPATEGWFKLRYDAKTNKILGIKGGQNESVEDESTVNIGTVQLKIGELKKVKKQLEKEVNADIIKMVKERRGAFVFAEPATHDSFIAAVNKEIAELEVSGDIKALDKIGNVQLYGYIVTLLSPGMSKNFEQNQNTIEFDVRVNVLDPPPSKPIIEASNNVYAFAGQPANFRFQIAPWRTGMNVVKGNVYSKESGGAGQPLATIVMRPVSETTPAEGQSRDYYGTVSQALSSGEGVPKEYIVKLEHNIVPNRSEKNVDLTVFPSVIEEDVSRLKNQFAALANYGQQMFFEYTPPSGQKIAADQFAIYFKTDADAQGKRIVGLNAGREDKLNFSASANDAILEIVWVDPISKKEIPIFPETSVSIKQRQPGLSTNFATDNIAGEDQLLVRIQNIKIDAPTYDPNDSEKKSNVNFRIVDTDAKVKGYTIVGTPKSTVNDDNTVQINFGMTGEPDDEGKVRGEISIKMEATSINPENGKVSEPTFKTYKIRVNKKMDTGGNTRGGRRRR